MYCKFCGKRIDDDSKFCSNCGEKVKHTVSSLPEEKKSEYYKKLENTFEEIKEERDKRNRDRAQKSNSFDKRHYIFAVVAIILIISIIVFVVSGGELRESDYEIDIQEGLLSYLVIITPERNISECSVELELYDYKDKLIHTETITKTNLRDGNRYTYLFKFDFLDSLKGTYIKYSVTGDR